MLDLPVHAEKEYLLLVVILVLLIYWPEKQLCPLRFVNKVHKPSMN